MIGLSFTTMATPGMGAVGSIRSAAKYGYDGVDLRVSDYLGEISLYSTAREISEIRSAYLSEGVKVSGLLCYNEYGGKDEASWGKMRDSLLRHLEIAAELGSPSIRIFGGNPGDFENRRDFIKRTSEVISEVLSVSSAGICILIQNHTNSFSAPEVKDLAGIVGSPFLGMVYSPDHSYINGEDIANTISELKGIIRQLYIADVIEAGSEFKGILPGKGRVPFASVCHALGGHTFGGWYTFKWEKLWDKSLEEPETALPYFIDYFKKLDN